MTTTFNVNDLKTGMKLLYGNGDERIVVRGVKHNYSADEDVCINPKQGSYQWDKLKNVQFGKLSSQVIKVLTCKHPYDIFYNHQGWEVIWEYKEKSEQELQIEKLEATIKQAQEQIEQLKKMEK